MPVPYDQSLFSLDVSDPDNAELIEMFLGELPNRVRSLQDAAESSDYELLRRLSHQLKGAAPGFGCDPIGARAADLEADLKNKHEDEIALDDIRTHLDALIASCNTYIQAA